MKKLKSYIIAFTFRCFIAFFFCVLISACNRTAMDEQSQKFVGVWQSQTKLIGGQALAEIKIDFRKDRSFIMEVGVGEKAHFLNAYPTIDQIKMTGKWSLTDDGEIMMDGKIEKFARMQLTGSAGRQGFMPEDRNESSETTLIPLPFENPLSVRVQQDGTLHLNSMEFRGRKDDESDDSCTSRMIVNAYFQRMTN